MSKLDHLICQALQASFGNAEPPLAVWSHIRRRILRLQHSARRGGQSVQESIGRCEMFTWNDVLVQEERRKDLLREAEEYRLARLVLAGRERRPRLYYRALTWLGRRLVAWGYRLQARYGVAATVPGALRIANCAQYRG